jgi:hypothetical protein
MSLGLHVVTILNSNFKQDVGWYVKSIGIMNSTYY